MTRRLRRLTPAAADRLRDLVPSYDEIGATGNDLMPPGYQHLEHRVVLGRGRDVFEQASRALLAWELQLSSGVGVTASSPAVEKGAVAVMTLGIGRVGLRAPVRVVEVVDEPSRRGFAYGTLPGHPERGEERFVIEVGEDEAVSLVIIAFSRPATLLARVAGPLGRAAQLAVTWRYGRALRS